MYQADHYLTVKPAQSSRCWQRL